MRDGALVRVEPGGVGAIVGSLVWGALSDAWGRKKLLVAGTFICATDRFCTASSAAGPEISSTANADRSTSAQASRMARCSALMTGDHQRDSHSASRRVTRSPYSSSSGAFDSYQCGRSQPPVSKNIAPSFFCDSCIGASRWSRSDSYCSAG